MKVRIGLGLSVGQMVGSPAEFCDVVDILEELDFDSLWMSDTAVGPAYDPLTALSFAAGRTSRLKLGTSVAVLPGRDPVLVAKQIALLDHLSDGRFLPVFGLGNPTPADRAPFAVERGARGKAFEENLAIVRQLWAEGSVPHPGGGAPATIRPRPRHHLDVWIGGRSPEALERVGRLGDGWLGNFQTPEEGGRSREAIVAAAAAADRSIDPEHFGTTIYYARSRRTPSGEMAVLQAMRWCGCASPPVAGVAGSIADGHEVEAMFPRGESELVALIRRHVAHGLSKFVLIPGERPDDWDEELAWLRAVAAQVET
jgi:probable F420-dependent oxidoreductase